MKPVMGWVLAVLASVFIFAGPAKAWNCQDPLASRVNVGATKPAGATAGDGDGQYYIGSDASNPNDYYVCEVPKPPTPPTPPTTPTTSNSSSSSNSSSNAAANSSSNSASNSNSTSTAKGGNASATGGNATAQGGQGGAGGSATGGSVGNVSSTSTVSNSGNSSSSLSNSGNSSNSNKNVAKGGSSNQSQTATASGNGVGNGNNSDNSSTVINDERSVASAYAPSMSATAPCFKAYAGGGQGLLFGASFGGGKIDANCAALEASRQAPSIIARCKIFLTTKYAKEAGVTMEDCMPQPKLVSVSVPAPAIVVPAPLLAPLQPITINMPAPVVTIIPPPVTATTPSIVVAAAATHHKPHVPCNPVPQGKGRCVVDNESIHQ